MTRERVVFAIFVFWTLSAAVTLLLSGVYAGSLLALQLLSSLCLIALGIHSIYFREDLSEFWGWRGLTPRGNLISGVGLIGASVVLVLLPTVFSFI